MHLLIIMFTLQFGGGHTAQVLTVDLPAHTYEFHFNEIDEEGA